MNKIKVKQQKGLLLTEIMIALPIATMIIVVLFSVLFAQYTAVMAESSRSNLRTSGQTLLINMQDELLFTIAFGESLNSDLTDGFESASAPSGTWSYDTSPQTLIINEIALDSTRRDDDRHIVRKRINNCESSPISSNPVAINNVIYFVKDNPGSKYDSLYKRTVTPTYDTCSIDLTTEAPCTPTTTTCLDIAKETTCPEGEVGNHNCGFVDSLLSDNVLSFDIQYFAENNVATAFPSSADKIEVSLVLGDTVYGKEVTADVNHTIRKVN